MEKTAAIRISGADGLHGTVQTPCAKNSVLPLLAASLLCEGTVRLRQVPRLSDVECALEMLSALGGTVERRGDAVLLQCVDVHTDVLPPSCMARMRSGVFFLAPVLLRTGRVVFSAPGGCDLGARPVDIHLDGLCRMGAMLRRDTAGRTELTAPGGLHGCRYALRLPSVGATETLLMAASLAEGETLLENAALEPEVLDLVRFLNGCGGCIRQLPGRRFAVRGVRRLYGRDFQACADRIWASTVLCAVAGCGGTVEVRQIVPETLSGLPQLLQEAGCRAEWDEDGVLLESDGRLHGIAPVTTAPYPGFATDAAPLLAAALLRAEEPTRICDAVFSRRFACAAGFAALGASVTLHRNCLTVGGRAALHGASLHAEDLRGAAALLIAALQADGESYLDGMEYMVRGYEDLPGTLCGLGAVITPLGIGPCGAWDAGPARPE